MRLPFVKRWRHELELNIRDRRIRFLNTEIKRLEVKLAEMQDPLDLLVKQFEADLLENAEREYRFDRDLS